METTTVPARQRPGRDASATPRARTATPAVAAEVLVCGSANGGDEGVGLVLAADLRRRLAADVRVRTVGQLGVDDLLAIPPRAGVVVVDAATGVRGGRVVEVPLKGLVDRHDELRPRCSRALAFPEVLGVAEVIRGHPLRGVIVLVGGVRFGPGGDLSPSVRRALPAMASAVESACASFRA